MSIAPLCEWVGMTRQNYYKQRRVRCRREVEAELVLELVRRERWRQPRLGGRKLLHMLRPEMSRAGVRMGRDKFLELLGRHDLLILRRPVWPRTTNSGHGFRVYPNLARDLELTLPHQLWVADITYIRTLEGFMYLCLIMDAYSRAVVGYDCSESLQVEGALRALAMAQGQLPAGASAMHHSDQGIQYCCRTYVEAVEGRGMAVSMTEQNHCYENAQAERLNGILKQEYGLGGTFARKREVGPAVVEAIGLYNRHRPHLALGYRVPQEVHGQAAA
jgi:transposase InsO family protein